MSDLEGCEVIACRKCGLRLEPAPGEYGHRKDIDCIKALRLANKEQKEVAQRLSLSLSTRFFAILEELAHDPECGVQYYTCDKDTGEKTHLGHASVKGIMAAIFTKFQEMGDWSPMQALQGELKDEQELNVRFENLLEKVHQADGAPLALELRRQVEELLHPGESEAPT